MFELRPYQHEAVQRGLEFMLATKPGTNGIEVLPTGSGKSLVIASIATELASRGRRCIVFQPSQEILEQNASKFLHYGYDPAVYSASLNSKTTGQITLAMIGSVHGKAWMFDDVRDVLIDECHLVNAKKGMYAEFLDSLGGCRVLGFSATPYRLSSDGYGGSMLKFLTRTKPKVFSKVVAYEQVGNLMKAGFLVKPIYHHVDGFKRSDLEYNTTGADYTDESIERHYNKIGFRDRLRRVVQRCFDRNRKNILVFTRFVKDAEELAAQFGDMCVVSENTPTKARAEIVAAFKSGELRSVSCVGTLGIGFDSPILDTVVLGRVTASLAVYYQQVGRLMRPHATKADAWAIDMVDHLGAFGRIEDLWLQPGGKSGTKWEVKGTGGKVLTNVYFNKPPEKGDGWRRYHKWRKHP